jgi:hypothetical protein
MNKGKPNCNAMYATSSAKIIDIAPIDQRKFQLELLSPNRFNHFES